MRGFVPFLLMMLVIAVILRVDLFFTVVYFLVAVYIASRLWVSNSVRNARLTREFPSRAFAGEEIEVRVLAHNLSRIPIPWLQVAESTPVDLMTTQVHSRILTLGSGSSEFFSYRLHCRRRGYYRLGPFSLQFGDLLGIDQQSVNDRRCDDLLVYPRLVPVGRLGLTALAAQPVIRARTPLIEDPARVSGVRDYQRGDSPRRIHWTASARSARLLVKQYDPSISRDTMIFLDLNPLAYQSSPYEDLVELAIVTAASIANHVIVRERLAAGLATEGQDPLVGSDCRALVRPPRRENAALISILEVLARVQPHAKSSFGALLRQESVRLSWGSTLVVISGAVDADFLALLLYLRRSGFAVTLLLVLPRRDAAAGLPVLPGIPVHVITSDRDVGVAQ